MTKNAPVIWTEGLFLQAQHFQQQERYLGNEIEHRMIDLHCFAHGFSMLELDQNLLSVGQLHIYRASGYFPDGTFFSIPDRDPAPPALNLLNNPDIRSIHLTLAGKAKSGAQVAWTDNTTPATRYTGASIEVEDNTQTTVVSEHLEVGLLNTRFTVNDLAQEGHVRLCVAELLNSTHHQAELNARFIPPLVCVQGNPEIRSIMGTIFHLLNNKIEQLKKRSLRKGTHSTSEIGDFLLLQACIKHRNIQAHLMSLSRLHPERLYRELLCCLGDLAIHDQGIALNFIPAYRHGELQQTFASLFDAIRESLAGVHDQHAIQIPLQSKPGGIYLAQITDPSLLTTAHFVMTVYAQAPDELIQNRFPNTVKIGPAERLRDLVNLNLPGVRLKHLQQKPIAMPLYADHLYFQLETRSDKLWAQLKNTGNLALHFAGDLPELRLELWAIREKPEVAS